MRRSLRWAALALCALLLWSAAACGAGSDGGKNSFAPGTVEDQTYTNRFAGITCTLDGDWEFLSEEEMAQQNEMTKEAFSDNETMQKALDSGKTVYDMMANADEGMRSINVLYENLGALYGKALSEEDYAKMGVEQVKTAMESIGMTVTDCQVGKVSFAGGEHYAILSSFEYMGVAVYQRQVCMKAGNYMMVVTAATWLEDTTDTILSSFRAL